jgi:hypothetical protein
MYTPLRIVPITLCEASESLIFELQYLCEQQYDILDSFDLCLKKKNKLRITVPYVVFLHE